MSLLELRIASTSQMEKETMCWDFVKTNAHVKTVWLFMFVFSHTKIYIYIKMQVLNKKLYFVHNKM